MNVILMADIIDSRGSKFPANEYQFGFKEMVQMMNEKHCGSMLSPLTITLGDEFQGVIKSVKEALQIIIDMEESMIKGAKNYKLRYVLHEGVIDTPINHEIAHGMVGQGLTDARSFLQEMKGSNHRFRIEISNAKESGLLNKVFTLYQYLVDRWSVGDHLQVSLFLEGHDYKGIAKQLGKAISSVWRKRNSLAIDEYLTCKDLILSSI